MQYLRLFPVLPRLEPVFWVMWRLCLTVCWSGEALPTGLAEWEYWYLFSACCLLPVDTTWIWWKQRARDRLSANWCRRYSPQPRFCIPYTLFWLLWRLFSFSLEKCLCLIHCALVLVPQVLVVLVSKMTVLQATARIIRWWLRSLWFFLESTLMPIICFWRKK